MRVKSCSVCFHADLWSQYVTNLNFCELENSRVDGVSHCTVECTGPHHQPLIFKLTENLVCDIPGPEIHMKTHTLELSIHILGVNNR